MSAKSSGLFEGKKGNKKGAASDAIKVKGRKDLISLMSLSIRRASEGDGKHAFVVALGFGGPDSLLLSRRKKFRCDDDLGFDDANALVKAVQFAASTDEIPEFRAFVLDDGCGVGYGSSAVTKESALHLRDDINVRICEQGRLQSREACEPVSYVCLRKNVRVGLIFAVAMVRLESGQHRSISFQMQRRQDGKEDEYATGDEELLIRAFKFLRSAAFEIWSKDGSNRASGQGDQSGLHHSERGLKHPFSYIGIEDGEKVDCCCGKNRSKGLMVACEECGVWEHAECLGYRFNSQIPADYICSACLRAQNEEVVFIRLDEQGQSQIQCSDELLNDSKESEAFGSATVCCVCGCEDNEDFESMIHPCSCAGGLAIAHVNCVLLAVEGATLKERTKKAASFRCPLCGGQGVVVCGNDDTLLSSQSGKEISPPKSTIMKRNTRRSSNSEQSSKGVKRLRSALVHPGIEGKNELTEKSTLSSVAKHEAERQAIYSGKKIDILPAESVKPETSVTGKRFADAAVTVPIKKRRIQLMEAVRSPSPPPVPPSPLLQSDDLVFHNETAKKVVRNTDGREVQNAQLAEMSGSSMDDEDTEGMTLKNLKAGFSNQKTELSKEQLSQAEKKDLGITRVNLLPHVAQSNSVQEEIEGTLTKDLKSKEEVQLHVKACKAVVKMAGPDTNVSLSSSLEEERDLQPSQVLTATCSTSHVLHNEVSLGGSPLWKLSSTMNSGCCQIVEDGENDQELQIKITEGSTTNSLATTNELQEQLNMIDATREMQVQHKVIHDSHIVEQQLNGKQISDESGNATTSLCNRDDRSHWDLNMEMEAWGQPSAKLSNSDPTLDRVEVSSSMLHSDSYEDGEVEALPAREDVTLDRNVDVENLLPETTEEKPKNELSTSMETLPAAKQIASLNSLDSDHAVGTKRPILDSEAFNQSKYSPRQIHCYEEEKLEDDSSVGVAKLSSSLRSMNSSLEANALFFERESEGKTINAMDDDTKCQLLASVGFATTDVAVDSLEPVSQLIPSGAKLVSKPLMGEALIIDTIKSVQIDATRHNSCPDLSLEIDTLDHMEGFKIINSQDDPSTDVKKGRNPGETIGEKAIQIGGKRESIEVDALEEDGQVGDSPRRFISDGDDSQEKYSKIRLGDPDDGAEYYLEAEDVDYGDSENEVEQGHEDGETYNMEIDEVTSACSQERMDFGDDEIDNHDDIQEYVEEEGQIIQWADSVDDQKLEAGLEEQYNSDTELEITHNGKDTNLETDELIQEENADIQDTQTINEELAGSSKPVKNDKEGSKDGAENAFDAPSSSKKISAVRTKSSGWDQLPEGFEKAEDALRAVKENSLKIGRGAFRGGFLSNPRRGSPFTMNTGPVERGRMDGFGRSSTRQYDFRMDDNSVSNFTASRRLGLGRSRGRNGSPVVLRERSRLESWDNDYGGPPGQWAPKRHSSPPVRFREASSFGQHGQANAAAIAAAKLESSGFLVAPDGTITKAGTANNALRGSPRPFSGGGRRSGGMMFNPGRGTLVRGEMNLGRRVGLGTGRGFGFGSDNISMNMGASPGARGRLGLNNREVIEPYRLAPHCVGNSVVEPSFGRPILDHSEKWNRRERHFSPASRKLNRASPPCSYRRSSSTSRSKSPRLRTPPRFGDGGSGFVLRRSRSPVHVRSVVKGDSQELSPSGRRSVPPPPKLPLPPPPPRGQRSPPAGLKRFSDRREGDRRYSDLEQTASVAQSRRTPPRRLSSHIEQTATTSDELDQQSLPSMQGSVLEKHKSSYTSEHISRSSSGRNLASMESFGKVNSEVQLLSDDEHGDGAARKGESSRHRLKDAYRVDKNDKDRKVDASYYRTKWEKNDSRMDFVKSRRDGRAGSYSRYSSSKEVDDEIAPRRRRAPS